MSETKHDGELGNSSMVGISEWGDDEPGVCMRERRMKKWSKKWEKYDKLPLTDEPPTLLWTDLTLVWVFTLHCHHPPQLMGQVH